MRSETTRCFGRVGCIQPLISAVYRVIQTQATETSTLQTLSLVRFFLPELPSVWCNVAELHPYPRWYDLSFPPLARWAALLRPCACRLGIDGREPQNPDSLHQISMYTLATLYDCMINTTSSCPLGIAVEVRYLVQVSPFNTSLLPNWWPEASMFWRLQHGFARPWTGGPGRLLPFFKTRVYV